MLKRRIATAVVMLVIFALDLFYAPSGLFALSIALLCAATGWEWGRLAGIQTDTGEVLFAILVGLSALICLYLPFSDAVLRLFFGAVLLFWLLVPLLFKARPAHAPMPHADVGLLCIGVVLITAAAIAIEYLRAQAPHASPWLLLFAFVIVWSMDIGAYFSGRRFGSHKLSPAISPGKTWEGVWGGVAVAILVLALVLAFVDLPPGIALPLALTGLSPHCQRSRQSGRGFEGPRSGLRAQHCPAGCDRLYRQEHAGRTCQAPGLLSRLCGHSQCQ